MINELIKKVKEFFKKGVREKSKKDDDNFNKLLESYVKSTCPYKLEPKTIDVSPIENPLKEEKIVYSDGQLENRIKISFDFEKGC